MKKIILILVALIGLIGSVNAEITSKGSKRTSYGYNEFYSITVNGQDITYYVPHYDYIETRYANDKISIMLNTLANQIQDFTDYDMTCVAQYNPNPGLDKNVAKLTKDKGITVGLISGGYIVVNLYYPDSKTFGTFIYY